MNMNKVSLATALLLSLTACSSGGGGGDSSPSKSLSSTSNAQNVQIEQKIKALQTKADETEKKLAQAEQATSADKKELEALKVEAQQAREATEKAKLAAESNATLHKQFQDLQAKANETEKKLAQAEQTANVDKKALEALKVEAKQAREEAEKAKRAAENATENVELVVENALKKAEAARAQAYEERKVHIKNLTKIAHAANIYEAEYLANTYSHLSEKEFSDYLKKREEKSQELNKLALDNGLEEYVARNFANNYKDKDQDEIDDELKRLKAEHIRIQQEREANEKAQAEREQKRQDLLSLAKEKGLENYEAENFSYNYQDKPLDEAKAFLEKRQNLLALAKEQGLDDYQEKNFYSDYKDKPLDEAKAFLEKRQNLMTLAKENGFDQYQAQNFYSEYKDKPLDEAKAFLEKRQNLMTLAKKNGFDEYEAKNFSSEYKDKSLDDAKAFFVRRQNLITLAKENGLNPYEAKEFAYANRNVENEKAIKALDAFLEQKAFSAKTSRTGLTTLTITTPQGFIGKFEEKTIPILDEYGYETGKTKLEWQKDIYNQKYSLVYGEYNLGDKTYTIRNSVYDSSFASGLKTLVPNLPKEGKATYSGVAFTHNKQGKLTYDFDFSTKEGYGQITNLEQIGTITLEKGKIGGYRDSGNATMRIESNVISSNAIAEDWKGEGVSGRYELDFYGPKAEEIAGKATLSQSDYIFDTGNGKLIAREKKFDVATKSGSHHDGYSPIHTFDIGFGGTRGNIQK